MRRRFSLVSLLARKKLEEGKGRETIDGGEGVAPRREMIGKRNYRHECFFVPATTTFSTVLGTRMAKIHRGLLCSPRFISVSLLAGNMDKWGRFRDNEIILIRGGEEVKKGNLIEEI